MASGRRLVSSGSEFEELVGYSRAVVDGDYVFLSGTTGYDYSTMTIPEDVVEQAEQCFKNIEAALTEAGTDFGNVVRVSYLLTKREDFKPCWPVLRKYLGTSRPAATMSIVGLFDEKMKIEVEVTARLPNKAP